MVEGRVIMGTLLVSMAAVVLLVILGLRDLDGTLGGPNQFDTILITAAFVAFIVAASLYSFTGVFVRGDSRGSDPLPASRLGSERGFLQKP